MLFVSLFLSGDSRQPPRQLSSRILEQSLNSLSRKSRSSEASLGVRFVRQDAARMRKAARAQAHGVSRRALATATVEPTRLTRSEPAVPRVAEKDLCQHSVTRRADREPDCARGQVWIPPAARKESHRLTQPPSVFRGSMVFARPPSNPIAHATRCGSHPQDI